MENFERELKKAKPLKGQKNDFQYIKLKRFIPCGLNDQEYNSFIKRICDKIKY